MTTQHLAWRPSNAPSGRRCYAATGLHLAREALCLRIGDHWEATASLAVSMYGEPGIVFSRVSGETAAKARAALEADLARTIALEPERPWSLCS